MTTEETRRRVRWAAVGGTVLAGAVVTVAIGAHPRPASEQPAVRDLTAREQALAAEVAHVNAANAARARTVAVPPPIVTYVPDPPVATSSAS